MSNLIEYIRHIFKRSEQFPLREQWTLTARNIKTGETIVIKGKNLIATVGKGLVGDMLIDTSGFDTGLTWQAIGTSTTAPAVGDTQLTAEAARLAITSRTRNGNVITLSTFFTAAQCTYNFKEAAIFGHSTANATPNSGIIFSHYLVSFDNSGGLYDITLDYVLTLG